MFYTLYIAILAKAQGHAAFLNFEINVNLFQYACKLPSMSKLLVEE